MGSLPWLVLSYLPYNRKSQSYDDVYIQKSTSPSSIEKLFNFSEHPEEQQCSWLETPFSFCQMPATILQNVSNHWQTP